MAAPPPWREHLRAALVLATGLWMLILGTPGLDFLRSSDLASEDERKTAFADYPDAAVWLGIGVATFNREVRLPVVRKLQASQRWFRTAQTWNLYRNGPTRVRHMEVRVDGALLHRSQSSEYTWRTPQLRNRRIRPMVESTCMARKSKNWRGLGRWVVAEVRRDFPDAKQVEIHCLAAPFPGNAESLSHKIVAQAPHWKPRMPK